MAKKDGVNRRKRMPLGVPRLKMEVDPATRKWAKDNNKTLRYINDDGARLMQAEDGGYEFVKVDDRRNITVGGKEQDDRGHVAVVAGTDKLGRTQHAYLMAIDNKYKEEDDAAKEAINKRVDQAIKSGTPQGVAHHGVEDHLGGTYNKNIVYDTGEE